MSSDSWIYLVSEGYSKSEGGGLTVPEETVGVYAGYAQAGAIRLICETLSAFKVKEE